MKKLVNIFTLLALLYCAMAFGEVGQWSSGWGQGVSEYTVSDAAGNSLYIACSADAHVSMRLTVKGVEYGSGLEGKGFDAQIDSLEISTPYDTASLVGANNFDAFWAALRKAKTLQIKTTDGQSISLPTAGSAKALPAWGTPEYACKTNI